MANLQIRDVPEDVRDELARVARARGTSLQRFLLELLTEEAHAAQNRAVLAELRQRSRGRRGISQDVTRAAMDAERDDRDDVLTRRPVNQ
jgi:hypothetical protein